MSPEVPTLWKLMRLFNFSASFWVGNKSLPQAKEFEYLGVLFKSDGEMERIGTVSAALQKLYQSVLVKRKLSLKAKFLIY